MLSWAETLLERPCVAGTDFALTDAVRCASPRQLGVDQAIGRCAELYMGRLLSLSQARVVGFCGKARIAVRDFVVPARYRVNLREGDVRGPIEFFGRERMLVGLRHPADFYRGSLYLDVLVPAGLDSLQSFLK